MSRACAMRAVHARGRGRCNRAQHATFASFREELGALKTTSTHSKKIVCSCATNYSVAAVRRGAPLLVHAAASDRCSRAEGAGRHRAEYGASAAAPLLRSSSKVPVEVSEQRRALCEASRSHARCPCMRKLRGLARERAGIRNSCSAASVRNRVPPGGVHAPRPGGWRAARRGLS